MAMSRPAPATVDAYISGFSPDVQAILERIRDVVRGAAPDAEETISYQDAGVQPVRHPGLLRRLQEAHRALSPDQG